VCVFVFVPTAAFCLTWPCVCWPSCSPWPLLATVYAPSSSHNTVSNLNTKSNWDKGPGTKVKSKSKSNFLQVLFQIQQSILCLAKKAIDIRGALYKMGKIMAIRTVETRAFAG